MCVDVGVYLSMRKGRRWGVQDGKPLSEGPYVCVCACACVQCPGTGLNRETWQLDIAQDESGTTAC